MIKRRRGFAAMPASLHKELSSRGGKAKKDAFRCRLAGWKGGRRAKKRYFDNPENARRAACIRWGASC